MHRMENVRPRPSYFIRSKGPDVESVRKAFSWLVQNSKPQGFMAVLGYGNLDGVIGEFIGEVPVSALKKQGRFSIDGVEILLVTERKLIYDARNCPLVAFYPNSKFLDELDSIRNISAMLVVPWIPDEVETWINARGAIELGAPITESSGPVVESKVVETALRGLTAVVNVSTGISHPSDRASAVQLFEILRDAGEPFTPNEVKAWLIGKGGWKATHAQDVAEVAQKVLQSRKLISGSRRWRLDILDIWRKES